MNNTILRNSVSDLRTFALSVLTGVSLALIATGVAQADNVPLVKVTSDAVQGEVSMSLEVDGQGAIQAMHYETTTGTKDRFPVGNLDEGVVISRVQGRDVVRIVGVDGFTSEKGGDLTIEYLRDGLSGKRGQFPVKILQSADSGWALYPGDPNVAPAPIKSLFFKRKRNFLGIVVGIDRIEIR